MPPYDASASVRGLRDAKRVALLMAPRLGDTLLMMTMAHNLIAHGREVTIFGDYAYGLRDWFLGMDIRPSLPEEQAAAVLKDSKNELAGKEFLAFLQTDKAAKVFEKYGFTVK